MAKIEDGKGKNGDMSVSVKQRGNVSAQTKERIWFVSRDNGLAYVVIFDGITAAANDYVAYLKNTSSTRNLFLSDVVFGGVNDIKWKIWQVTGTAIDGETVTPVGTNLSKNIPAEATCMAGNTTIGGLTTGFQMGSHRSSANNDAQAMAHGSTILGPGDAIAVEYDAGTGGECSLEMHFFYEDIGAT